jgi:hypothetical protein
LISIAWQLANAQYADNVRFFYATNQSGKKVMSVTYDLIAPYSNISCQVKVKFFTNENFFYLKEVSGDAGKQVYPGKDKQIIWDYFEELIHFNGENVNLQLEVTPTINVSSKVKKGREIQIQIASVLTLNKSYNIKLYRNGKEIGTLGDVLLASNVSQISIPRKSRARRNYQLAIADETQTFYSNTFKIKRRIGYGWKILPFLAVPVYLYVTSYLEENKPLPGPPTID